jgi:hypothetical protein
MIATGTITVIQIIWQESTAMVAISSSPLAIATVSDNISMLSEPQTISDKPTNMCEKPVCTENSLITYTMNSTINHTVTKIIITATIGHLSVGKILLKGQIIKQHNFSTVSKILS